jgi:arabinogalactan oligomer/maltooligosaccharide transport system permease protein
MANDRNVPWGEFAAGGLLVLLPTMIVFLIVQRYFQGGLTVGGQPL